MKLPLSSWKVGKTYLLECGLYVRITDVKEPRKLAALLKKTGERVSEYVRTKTMIEGRVFSKYDPKDTVYGSWTAFGKHDYLKPLSSFNLTTTEAKNNA